MDLTWDAATDGETEILSYNINRGDQNVGSTRDQAFRDAGLGENTVTTPADTTRDCHWPRMASEELFEPPILVDSHVHFHECFDLLRFLDAANRNFDQAGRRLGLDSPPLGLLILTEGAEDRVFRRWRAEAGRESFSGWSFARTGEEVSLAALLDGRLRMIVVAGRQVPTAESLEVLALGCDTDFEERRSITETLQSVREAGAVPVVPWGFGKWWFQRGALMNRMLEEQRTSLFFLGDNGGRPRAWPRPPLFSRAEKRGIHVLPGSDPLPFPTHENRAGSYGFLLSAALNSSRPVASLKANLKDPDFQPQLYGSGEGILPFLRSQLAMQRRRWTSRPRP